MVSPLTVDINPRQTTALRVSPYKILMLAPKEGSVAAAANAITDLPSDAVADASIGTTAQGSMARRWYDHLESRSNVLLSVLPYTVGGDLAASNTNAVAAVNVIPTAAELAKISGPPDLILAPDLTGRATTASPVVTALEAVCADQRVEALAIVDAYHMSNSPQADVTMWATNNLGDAADILAISNRAAVGAVTEWGSVIAAGHIARYAAIDGVGSQPFSLRHPVSGIGTISPERVFSLADGTAAAITLANAYLSSLILHDGGDYLWGGRLDVATTGDPRTYFGNAVIAKRIIKRARAILAPFFGRRATSFVLEDMALVLGLALQAEFGTLVDSIVVETPTFAGTTATVPIQVGFHNFIGQIRLTADVFLSS